MRKTPQRDQIRPDCASSSVNHLPLSPISAFRFLLYELPDGRDHSTIMSSAKAPQPSLFQVYLRLRPPISQQQDDHVERCLTVDTPEIDVNGPTQIVLQPPSDVRKRAAEKFGFTKVFEESASQLNVFEDTGLESIIRGVLSEGRDGLVATLGVTGSGKVGG